MVQILPKVESFGSQFGKAIGGGLGTGLSEGYNEARDIKKKYSEMQKENEAAKKMGINLYDFVTPESRQLALSEGLKGINQQNKEKLKGEQKQREYGEELRRNETQLRQLEKERELENGELQPYVNNVTMAERVSRPAKDSKKTQASQPIDPGQLSIMESVRNTEEYQNAEPLKKYQIMTRKGVSRENAAEETDIASKQAELEQKKIDDESKKKTSEEEFKQREREFFHKETEEVDKKIYNESERAKKLKPISMQIRAAIKKEPTGALTTQNLFKHYFKGTALENLALTPEGALIESSVPQFLEGMKEVFGVRLSDADLAIVQGKLVDLGKSPEANESILQFFDNMGDLANKKEQISVQIKDENNGYRPRDYLNQINKRYDQLYGDQMEASYQQLKQGSKVPVVKVQAPNKQIAWVPINKLDQALAIPGTIKL
jgi:hypothetical protein